MVLQELYFSHWNVKLDESEANGILQTCWVSLAESNSGKHTCSPCAYWVHSTEGIGMDCAISVKQNKSSSAKASVSTLLYEVQITKDAFEGSRKKTRGWQVRCLPTRLTMMLLLWR